jgi:energy-converting hydrogenase B subunit Q
MFWSTCNFAGCTNKHRARGLCSSHLDQLARGKELTPLLGPHGRKHETCTFPDCDRKHHGGGLCNGHDTQRQRGQPLRPLGGKGRWLDPKGYVYIRCPDPEHPNARSKPGWIAEHVWVMSQMLGRPLHRGESVHHRNNIKDDNRPENLELWHTHQPTGARVVDTVTWARWFLERYGDEFPNEDLRRPAGTRSEPGSLARVMSTGGSGLDGEERPLRRAPQLAVLLEGGDRKGLLHDMTAAILRHGGDIVLVEIIERGARSVVYWELDGIDDPRGLMDSFLEIDVVESLQRLPTMYQVWGKRIIVVGAGAQVGQVAIGAIGEADRHNIRGEKISVDTIPIVGEADLASAVRAVARLPRAVAVVLAGSLMGGEVTKAVDEVRARGILVVSLNMAGSAPGHADLVVTDPVQAGVMAVMAIASTASFDIARVRGHHF